MGRRGTVSPMKVLKASVADDLAKWVKEQASKQARSESSIVREAVYAFRYAKENGNGNG